MHIAIPRAINKKITKKYNKINRGIKMTHQKFLFNTRKRSKREEELKKGKHRKHIAKKAYVNPSISVTTLNINELF